MRFNAVMTLGVVGGIALLLWVIMPWLYESEWSVGTKVFAIVCGSLFYARALVGVAMLAMSKDLEL